MAIRSRSIFEPEHEAFRESVGTFLDKEAVPFHQQWEKDGIVDREVWAKAGAQGLLALQLPEEYGGGGTPDFRYNLVVNEEMTRRGIYGCAFPLFNDMIVPYFVSSADEEQQARWYPGLCAGTTIAAIAMTEPGAGSDLQGIRTSAVDAGDHYVLNGQKTFISNGILADLVVVVARTDPDAGHQGISLLVVERGMPGFERGRNLDKIGMHAQDTSELSFTDVRVPAANLLGDEGGGFIALMQNLPRERIAIGATALAGAEHVFATTLDYCRQRRAFGRPIGSFQHSRFQLAEMATELAVARAFTDRAITEHVAGRLSTEDAAMVKWWDTELCNRVVDRCVQLFGGYGYMREYPVARAFADGRVQSIFGGTTEIMKEIIGRGLGV
jgi:acyl-CoA dehydrogenase